MTIHHGSFSPLLEQVPIEQCSSETMSSSPCIHQLFEEQVKRTPDAVAITYEQQYLSYQVLDQLANQLAHYLQRSGVEPGVLVGICMERGLPMVISVLAVLKAGGGYVPLDPTYPRERLIFMWRDSQVKLLLTQRSEDLPDTLLSLYSVICLDAEWRIVNQESTIAPYNYVTQRDIAYVIYTSGSTGLPKGVLIEHKGLGNMVEEQIRIFGVQPAHRVAQFASFSFDASISELFMALLVGAQVCLIPQDRRWPVSILLQYLQEHAITTITLPPSALAVLPPEQLPALQTVISAGEELSSEIVARWLPGCTVFNAYGPTENTVCATIGLCREMARRPSIGYPIAHNQIYLLDASLRPVPIGVSAEVYIGGIGLARGYFHRSDLTAEKFLPDPFSSQPGARLYKTGDLARYLPDGSIECIGRTDRMVKVRGFRIELGEVEAVLEQHPWLLHSLVTVQKDRRGAKRLVAYVILRSEYASDEKQAAVQEKLAQFLQEKLPIYMLPAAFIVLNTFPLTPNGKIDQSALPIPPLFSRT